MNYMDLHYKENQRIKEKYMDLIHEYLKELKENKELKVVVRSIFNDKDKFINNIELAKVIDYDQPIYITKRQDEVESIYAAETIQKIIIANFNMIK